MQKEMMKIYNSFECIDSIKLIHGDCLDIMPTLADKIRHPDKCRGEEEI